MSVAGGTRLGPYEVLSPLGAGGMGEVYKARDTRLDRIVAVKVLPDGGAALPEVKQRFEREARAVSALNHPHICSLFDIGSQDGVDYLVMEYLEGETLAERVKNGPLPVEQALHFGIDIAGALEAAHRHGVIHRDLKPSNIMLTATGPKILDFGLAKFEQRMAVVSGGSALETLTSPLTGRGTIVGTLQYMAPEQLEGKDADARTDLFAFGAVMYEMITGRRAFVAGSQAALISSIMTAEPPPLSTVQPLAAPALDHVVRTCLSKDPADRWQSAHDVLVQLKWIAGAGSQAGMVAPAVAHGRSRERVIWMAVAALLLLAVAALGYLYVRRPPAEARLMRLQIDVPPNFIYSPTSIPLLSPDGRYIAFIGSTSPGRSRIWVRPLDDPESKLLPGTEEATFPFWSPDSRYIGFFAGKKLKKIDLLGSPPQAVCDTEGPLGSGTWNREGTILFSSYGKPLRTVPASGGEPQSALQIDVANREDSQLFPLFLPDGRHFLYFSRKPGAGEIRAGTLGSADTRRVLGATSSFLFSSPGWLLFLREQTLMAQAFDTDKLQLSGDARAVTLGVGRTGIITFSTSATGLLAWRDRGTGATHLVSCNREGQRSDNFENVQGARQIFVSPDEKRLSLEVGNLNGVDIWLLDLSSGILSRVTSDPALEQDPVWSPDGKELVFASNRSGVATLYKKTIGGGPESLLFKFTDRIYPTQWLSDGSILFLTFGGKGLYRVSSNGQGKAETLLENEFEKDGYTVSPDAHWVAYNSLESGQWEVYVASFPSFTNQRQISNGGGCQPLWRKDGRELFYLTLEGKLMSLDVKAGSTLDFGLARTLFQTNVPVNPTRNQYAVADGGRRFLLLESAEPSASPMLLVVNWPAAIASR
jgi:eukaryotic-like serine/threonine-protein kinase